MEFEYGGCAELLLRVGSAVSPFLSNSRIDASLTTAKALQSMQAIIGNFHDNAR